MPEPEQRAASADRAHLRDLRTVRVLYFCQFSAIGVFFTFINVYYYSLGLSGTQIGLINTLGPLAGIAGTTLWSILNDRFEQTRLLLLAAVVGTMLSAAGLSAARLFGLIVLAACCYSFFANTIVPLVDGTTLGILGSRREDYGRQRLWGSVGFLLTTLAIGPVLDRLGTHAMFGSYLLVMALVLLAGLRLPPQPVRIAGSVWRGLSSMVRQPAWLLFVASFFILGLATSGMVTFLSVTVRVMGGSDTLVGIAWTASALSELPVLLWSARLLRRLGAGRLLMLGFSAYAVRMLWLSVMPSPVWTVVINGLLGCSFALTWIGAVAHAGELAPAKLRTTSQGFLTTTSNLAAIVGAFLSGRLFDLLGPAGLFRVLAALCLVALLLFAGGRLALVRRPASAD